MELASLIMKMTGWPGLCSPQSGGAALTGNQGSPGTLRREEPASDPASNQAMASGERLILETTIHTTASSHIVKDD
jgi:hypothetical protein